MISILIVDDHELVRSGIKSFLRDEGDIEVVAEANSGEEAVILAKKFTPDLILMDINMPGTDGFTASLQLLKSMSTTKILVISSQEDQCIPPRLLKMGVAGYLSKNATQESLLHMIRALCTQSTAPPTFSWEADSYPTNLPFHKLSDREFQIALMIAKGMQTEEVAERVFLNKKTIQGYHRNILKKLDIQTDTQLIHLVIQHRLIDFDSI